MRKPLPLVMMYGFASARNPRLSMTGTISGQDSRGQSKRALQHGGATARERQSRGDREEQRPEHPGQRQVRRRLGQLLGMFGGRRGARGAGGLRRRGGSGARRT